MSSLTTACPSRKRGYRTRRKAIVALDEARAQALKGYPNRSEQSAYRCPRCGLWHLTSYPTQGAA